MWIGVAIVAYFLLALVVVIDKYLLTGPLPNPKLYAFAIGLLGGLVFVLVPFGFLLVPAWPIIVLGVGAGVLQIFAIFALFSSLKKFEASRIIPAIGGLLPIFTLLFTISLGRAQWNTLDSAAFLLLVAGSVIISGERKKFFSFDALPYALVAALLFALFVIFSKFAYENQSFLSALLWIIFGSFIGALSLLLSGELRRSLWNMLQRRGVEKQTLSIRTLSLFAGNQALGAAGFVLQNWAVALAPFAYVAFVNALEGTKYVFVLALAGALSLKFPRAFKEELGKSAIAQKLIAIASIGIGLFLLAL